MRIVGAARSVRWSFMASLAATALRESRVVGRYDVELDAEWTANGHCTAGHLASVLTRAVLLDPRAPFPVVVALTVRYLQVVPPGHATVDVDLLGNSTGHAEWSVTMHAGGQLCVAALISAGAHHPAPDGRAPPPEIPAQDRCVLLPTQAPGFDLPVMGILSQSADPAGLTWLGGEPSGRGLAQGWVRFHGGSAPDVVDLVAALDSLPTATFDLGLRGWAATVDLSTHVLGVPAPGPLRLRRRVRETAGDLVTLTYDVWDAESSLVATGLQLCKLRS